MAARTDRRVRVIHVLPALPVGGAETLVRTMVQRLNHSCYDLGVCSLTVKGPIGKEIEQLGIPVWELNSSGRWYDWRSVVKLVRLLHRAKPQIVHTHLFNANVCGRSAALLARVPVIIASEHGIYPWKNWLHRFLDRVLINLTAGVVVVSHSLQEFLIAQEGLATDKVWVITDGVDPSAYVPTRPRDEVLAELNCGRGPVIGTVGRLIALKGQHFLIRAFAEIIPKFSGAVLILVGDGPRRRHLESLAKELKIESHVRFLGWRRDVPDLLNAMDVFVLPSLREGFGIALVEAMLLGVPTVASDIGALREISEDGEYCRLVETGNVVAIQEEIVALLGNPEQRSQLGHLGRSRVLEHYTISNTVRQLEKVYTDALRDVVPSFDALEM